MFRKDFFENQFPMLVEGTPKWFDIVHVWSKTDQNGEEQSDKGHHSPTQKKSNKDHILELYDT